MNLDFRRQLPHSGSDLDELQSYHRKLSMSPFASTKMKPAECMWKNISYRMEKQTKLVGLKTAAGCPVREQMRLMFFDEKLHRSPSTVDGLVDKPLIPVLKVSHSISHKQPEGVALHFDDNPLGLRLALRLVEKLTKNFYRPLLLSISLLGFLHKRLGFFLQGIIWLEPKNIFYLLLFAKLIDCRTTVIRVAPKKDAHLGPGLPDPSYHPLENRDNLLSSRTFSRMEYCCHQLPAFSFIDMDRHEAVVIMKGIEKSQLLMIMSGIIGIIYIQYDPFGRLIIRFDKNIHKYLGYTVKIRARKPVLKPAHGGLTGQRLLTRKLLTGHLQHRIIPQFIRIIAILPAAGNLEHSLLEKFDDLMFNISGMSAIPKHLGHPVKKTHLSFHLTQEKEPGIRADFSPLEVCFDFFSTNIFKKKQLFCIIIFVQGCFLLIFTLTYYKTIRYEGKQLFL